MSSLGWVIIDGVLSFGGSVAVPASGAYGFTGINNSFGLSGAASVIRSGDGGAYFWVFNGSVGVNSANLVFGSGGTFDTGFSRLSSGALALGTNTAGDFTGSLKLTTLALVGKINPYNAIPTVGMGVPAIFGYGRVTGQTSANASIATYTNGAADGTFEVSANVTVTISGSHTFIVECAYTDEGNVARVLTLDFSSPALQYAAGVSSTQATTQYAGRPLTLRAKAGTVITIRSNAGGTYTGVTYNAEGIILQKA